MKPPFVYFGGKSGIACKIVRLLPPHVHYVEPFAGGMSVLLAKKPAPMETVNYLTCDIVNFWRVLRDNPDDLERACALTPHSRAEHQLAYEQADDDLERARRTWIRLTQGRGGQPLQRTGWRFHESPHGGTALPSYLDSYIARLHPAAQRLRHVSIECRPPLEVIAAYGKHPGLLIYADPPYLDSIRTHGGYGNVYAHEMRAESDHRALADALHAARAAVVLSGYHSPIYDELYLAPGRGDRALRQLPHRPGSHRGAVVQPPVPARPGRPIHRGGGLMLPAATPRPPDDKTARAHLRANIQAASSGHWHEHHIALPADVAGDFTPYRAPDHAEHGLWSFGEWLEALAEIVGQDHAQVIAQRGLEAGQ